MKKFILLFFFGVFLSFAFAQSPQFFWGLSGNDSISSSHFIGTKAGSGAAGSQVVTTGKNLTLTADGNVGIGLTNPGVKLDVAGVVRAHEIKVCLNQGCDYVFEDDYNLMNLKELSNFIKTNKHLPDVAPAVKMETEGINLSEMNALLLRKIEELTLYIIGQEEQMEDLQKRLSKLENKKGGE